MSFSEDETELDRVLGEMDIDELNLSPESAGGVKSPSADVRSNRNIEGQAHVPRIKLGYLSSCRECLGNW